MNMLELDYLAKRYGALEALRVGSRLKLRDALRRS